MKGKQVRASSNPVKTISTSRPLELPHMDLSGSSLMRSVGSNEYIFVIIDDYSKFT